MVHQQTQDSLCPCSRLWVRNYWATEDHETSFLWEHIKKYLVYSKRPEILTGRQKVTCQRSRVPHKDKMLQHLSDETEWWVEPALVGRRQMLTGVIILPLYKPVVSLGSPHLLNYRWIALNRSSVIGIIKVKDFSMILTNLRSSGWVDFQQNETYNVLASFAWKISSF